MTQDRFADLAAALAREPGVTVGQPGKRGFGSSALQVHGKIFAMISSAGDFVVKLPSRRVEELVASGAGRRFDAGRGRLMKEWLAIDPGSDRDWLPLAREALRYLRTKR